MPSSPPTVHMRGIVKRFGDVTALDRAELELRAGEIHALLGENGAGKSTLMHVLAGVAAPDGGVVEVSGSPVRFRSARAAAQAGIGMVHQHFMLAGNLSVAENLELPARGSFFLPRGGLAARALALAEELGWSFTPETPVWQLPVGAQQRLEIVKVLAGDPRVLILDEPTAVLAPTELEELFTVLRRLRDRGTAIVFISHKLNEVLRLCDRVTVLRGGRNAGTVAASGTDAADLARRMVGEDLPPGESTAAHASPVTPGAPVLRLRDLYVRGDRGLDAVRGVSLKVGEGEIVGLAGVDGNGQAELAEAVVGIRRPSAGQLRIGEGDGPTARGDIGYIPGDRRRAGLAEPLSVRDNLILELHAEPAFRWGPWLRWRRLNDRAQAMLEAYDIRGSGLGQRAGSLSGGNGQKIVIARALEKRPRLLVAVNPTRGLDVCATAYVHEQLLAQRARGAGILLISTELDEVLRLSDRVGVLYEGRLMGMVSPQASRETLGLMMGGRAEGDGARAA